MDRIMLGWLLSGLVMGLLEKLLGTKIWAQAISMLAGLIVCYIVGTAWFMVVSAVYGQHHCRSYLYPLPTQTFTMLRKVC